METTVGAATLTSLNSYTSPLALDSTSSPTLVTLSQFPAGLTIGAVYTFEVTAIDVSEASINAKYTITVTIGDSCDQTTFSPGQP